VFSLAVVRSPGRTVGLSNCVPFEGDPPVIAVRRGTHTASAHADHASCLEHGGALQLSPGSIPCDHGTDASPSLLSAKNSDAFVILRVRVGPNMRGSSPPIELLTASRGDVSQPHSTACCVSIIVELVFEEQMRVDSLTSVVEFRCSQSNR
jgi:hypothetical protein